MATALESSDDLGMRLTWTETTAVATDVLAPKVAELLDACDDQDVGRLQLLVSELRHALDVAVLVRPSSVT